MGYKGVTGQTEGGTSPLLAYPQGPDLHSGGPLGSSAQLAEGD